MKANTMMLERHVSVKTVDDASRLSNMFVNRITQSNKHVVMMTVAYTGSGKSYANLRLAYACACELARRRGGVWQDYFSMDNVAVIDEERIFELLDRMKRYQIYLLDDIGVTWNARKWREEGNQVLNDIFQVFRTENCVLLLTLPDTFLLDKVPRTGVHYYMEMIGVDEVREISWAKFFEAKRKHRKGVTFYEFPRGFDGTEFRRYIFPIPPEELVDEYEPIRRNEARRLRKEKLEEYHNMKEASEAKEEKKKTKGEVLTPAVHRLVHERGLNVREACSIVGLDASAYYKWVKRLEARGVISGGKVVEDITTTRGVADDT